MSHHCPECGHTFHSHEASEAQARISDLETQVRLLNTKLSQSVEKLSDYEDEIRNLRDDAARLRSEREENTSVAPLNADKSRESQAILPPARMEKEATQQQQSTPAEPTATRRQSLSRLSSLTSYLPSRKREEAPPPPPVPPLTLGLNKSAPNLSTAPGPDHYLDSPTLGHFPHPTNTASSSLKTSTPLTLLSLQTSLENERTLRQQAESSLQNAQSELEELTAQLFGQANEMVAAERKERAKLEERVKTLESKDNNKAKRLERLEKAVDRIERVRRLVVEHEREYGVDAYAEVQVRTGAAGNEKTTSTKYTRPGPASKRRHGLGNVRGSAGGKGRPEVVSEEEGGNDDSESRQGRSEFKLDRESTFSILHDENYDLIVKEPDLKLELGEERSYEFDVKLRVWRRSKANVWRSPSFD